jgi:hypothetical protein
MMKLLKSGFVLVGSLGLLFLGACSSGSNQAGNPSPAATTAAEPKPTESASSAASTDKMASDKMASDKMSAGDKHGGQGGQVLEVGAYHLELVPEKEADVTHLDVFLQKGDKHEAVPNAKMSAQVQLPDGSQKTLAFKYDPTEKHYTAKLPGAAAGAYKVAILSDIDGKKVNGRFNFTR